MVTGRKLTSLQCTAIMEEESESQKWSSTETEMEYK